MRVPSDLRSFRPDSEGPDEYRARYIESLPPKFQHLACDCSSADMKKFLRDHWGELTITYSPDVGIVKCRICDGYKTLWTYLEVCFNCEEMYVVKVCPDKMLLCDECGD